MELTHEMVERMEAGAEIDALVAELVMGWHREEGVCLPPRQNRNTHSGTGWCDATGQTIADANKWSPSTDIAAAWEAVEKMKDTPLRTVHIEWHGSCWRVNFGIHSTEWNWRNNAQDLSAPLAISRAAILATIPLPA